MTTLTYYWHPDCGGCRQLKPVFKEIAKEKGWKYKEVDVVDCETKICDTIEYVPTVYVDDKMLNFKEMEQILKK